MMEVGQKVLCRPVTIGHPDIKRNLEHAGREWHPVRTGTICYVQPDGRYVTVAIEEPGGIIRESFKPWEVQVVGNQKKKHKC